MKRLNMQTIKTLPLLAAVTAMTLLAGNPAFAGDEGNPQILPPSFSAVYSELSVAHWKWTYSIPAENHPLLQDGKVDLSQDQPSGPIWFLGGSFAAVPDNNGGYVATANRIGTVPDDKALFFPILDAECSVAEGNGAKYVQLRDCAISDIDPAAGLACVIDGKPVKHLEQYRFQSRLFVWGPLPANNLLGFAAGTVSPAVSDGYFLLLYPLSPGKHTIHFTGGVPGFTLDITYHLTVVKSSPEKRGK
jgi:hypothetical protein